MGSKDENDEFIIKRNRFSLRGKFNDLMSYYSEFDTVAKDNPVTYVWVDLNFCPEAKLRIGRIYYPFGIEYTTPPNKYDTINVTQTFFTYFGGTKDIGVQLSGEVRKFIKYALAIVNGNEGVLKDDNDQKDIVIHLVFTPKKNLGLGISHYGGEKDKSSETKDKRITGGELSFSYNPLFLKAEYGQGKLDKMESRGWYIQLIYNFHPKWEGLLKYEDWDPNLDKGANKNYRTTLGLNYFFNGGKVNINYG